jgi:hypothetical protein
MADCDQVDAVLTGNIFKHRIGAMGLPCRSESSARRVSCSVMARAPMSYVSAGRPFVRSKDSAFASGRLVSSSCCSRIGRCAGQHVRREFDCRLSRGVVGMQIQPGRYRRAGMPENGRDRRHGYACLDQHGAKVMSESMKGAR